MAAAAAKPTAWQDIQQLTFTRWCNEHLKKRGLHVNDLAKDLKNGILLCNLLEVISGKSLGTWNRHPKVPMQQHENCDIAVSFIQAEGLKLVNISGDDIHNCRLKLILGLIWTLILRYQIHSGQGDNDLLRWVQSKIPEYNIKGFTKDWNDGRAICGLIEALSPGLVPDHKSLDPKNALANATRGIDTGDEKMGIAKLILPDEMTNPRVDDKAMMTYISQYRDWHEGKRNKADLCNAYGPGLYEGVVNQLSQFQVATPGGGRLEVKVVGPKSEAKVNVVQNGNSYQVSYTPTEPGTYFVHVTYDGAHIPGSIFKVVVLEEESLGGEGKVRVFYSTTSSSEKGRSDVFQLQDLLTLKKIHLRPDFEPWIPVDIMDREDREAVFRKAGTRALPIVYIDDKYTGDFDTISALNEAGRLDKLLGQMDSKYKRVGGAGPGAAGGGAGAGAGGGLSASYAAPKSESKAAPKAASPAKAAGAGAGKKFCTGCGETLDAGVKFCAQCGTKL